MLNGDCVRIHGACSHLFALVVGNEVLRAVWPDVLATPVLLTVFPTSFIAFAVWIVHDALPTALVVFKLAFVGLTAWPHIGALAVLLALLERAEVKATVWPLEQAVPMHRIVEERPLVNLAS